MSAVHRILVLCVFLTLLGGPINEISPALAIQPDEVLEDPVLEARARTLSKDIRCLVCQNQSIDDSNADLARDLRLVVRERLVAGDSDDAVKAFLVERYGSYVLLTPPFTAGTVLLWTGPFLLALVGGLSILLWYRRQSRVVTENTPVQLSKKEQDRLAALLSDPGHKK